MSLLDDPTWWFPVPGVCTAYWTDEDWERCAEATGRTLSVNGFPEPDEMIGHDGKVWVKTNQTNAKGDALYRRKE